MHQHTILLAVVGQNANQLKLNNAPCAPAAKVVKLILIILRVSKNRVSHNVKDAQHFHIVAESAKKERVDMCILAVAPAAGTPAGPCRC